MKMVNGNFFTWLKVNFKTTYLLLAINLILGILIMFLTFVKGNDAQPLLFMGAQVLPGTEPPYSALTLDAWRFLTSAFLHDGLIHLFFNMYALLSVGTFVERYYGGKKLFLTYIYTAIFGSVLSFIMSLIALWSNGGVSGGLAISVGASGAIFGLIGLILGNRFLKKNVYEPELNVDIKGLVWIVIVNLALGFGVDFLGTGFEINNWAHIGGLLSGMILGAFLNTKNAFDVPKWKRRFEVVLFWVSVGLFVLAWAVNIISMIISAGSFLATILQTLTS